MILRKLTIVDGIIQDKEIGGIPVKLDIVEPKGKRNVRTLIPLKEWWGVTQHDTGNDAPTASDEMHGEWSQNVENSDKLYVGAHLYVDEDSITQVIPINEEAYHAGDGVDGNGNTHTIAVEMCINGNLIKSEQNAKHLVASLLLTKGGILFKHQDWNGKYCPRTILEDGRWEHYKESVYQCMNRFDMDNWKLEGFDWFVEKGFMNNPDIWIDELDDAMPTYAILNLIKRAVESLKE